MRARDTEGAGLRLRAFWRWWGVYGTVRGGRSAAGVGASRACCAARARACGTRIPRVFGVADFSREFVSKTCAGAEFVHSLHRAPKPSMRTLTTVSSTLCGKEKPWSRDIYSWMPRSIPTVMHRCYSQHARRFSHSVHRVIHRPSCGCGSPCIALGSVSVRTCPSSAISPMSGASDEMPAGAQHRPRIRANRSVHTGREGEQQRVGCRSGNHG